MEDVCIALVAPDGGTHALLYDAVILVPDIIFLAFLAYTARRCYDILCRSPSMIMWTYYSLVWAVTLCNVVRTSIQLIGSASSSHSHVGLWNVLWLITRFIMVMLEVSVVVFLLHGYVASSAAALKRTLLISGAFAAVDTILQAIFIWSLDIQLYVYAGQEASMLQGDMVWRKWAFWVTNALLFMLVYLGLLLLPLTRWRDLLPAKDMFHYYVRILFAVNLIGVVGAIMIGKHVSAGYCIYGVTNIAYYGFYAPLLYYTFLASFFQSDDADLENYYYSEMSDAGFLSDLGGLDDHFLNAP